MSFAGIERLDPMGLEYYGIDNWKEYYELYSTVEDGKRVYNVVERNIQNPTKAKPKKVNLRIWD